MMAMLFLLALVSGLFIVTGSSYTGCYKLVDGPQPSHIVSPEPRNYLTTSSLPQQFDWRSQSYLTPPTNQFLPSPCGSCWAHASTGALTDRFIIHGKTIIPPLSPQVLLDCGDDTQMGSCHGGSDLYAYKFIHTNGITDVTCSPYMGVTQTNWGEGGTCDQRMCRQCDRFGSCDFTNGTIYRVDEYSTVNGEEEMMAEIYARGPIACSLNAHSPYFEKYTSGIIADLTPYNFTTHVVTIVGWGVQTDITYWIGRNSFGTAWGEQGWFKLQRGTNTLNMEKRPCSWAMPKL